ncbi:hypothetical protein PULV_a4059 [Pseudoalteromonas ulvae UL12]|uniref:hypothetical protein n=1 Tax=Pseudoalteromonas ulvae TaxID=107327 RepID=UPI00186B78AC|nr:hypothetical protein [Pseudoalteromonas ulvae]MBE0362242.1 hypothetical protein [Pseudoalteromonas ulvae UL12]
MSRILSKIAYAIGVGGKIEDADTTYIGQGFNKGLVDNARLTPEYEYFELITEGDHKGKYKPVFTFGYQSDLRNKKQEAEMVVIYKSGKEIYAPDPKADPQDYTEEALAKRVQFIKEQGRDNDFMLIGSHRNPNH